MGKINSLQKTRTSHFLYIKRGGERNQDISGVSKLVERERSMEEEDILSRSTKKYKEHHLSTANGNQENERGFSSSSRNYTDRLVKAIPIAYEQAFSFASSMQEDEDSDGKEPELGEGCVAIGLTREEKMRIRAPWALSLIVFVLKG